MSSNGPHIKHIPATCDVCRAYPASNLVPDRFELDDWTTDVYCPRCIDEFLSVFPIYFVCLMRREIIGRLSTKTYNGV